jgi:predicted membrane protein
VGILAKLLNGYIPVPEKTKTVLNIVLALIVVGIALWAINTYVPMAGSIKAILNFVVVIATCVIVLQSLGLWNGTVALWNKLMHRGAQAMEHHEAHAQEATAPAPSQVVK